LPTPPIGLAPALQDQHDVLPDWSKQAPDLHEDAYAMADALWWSRKLGASQALGADVAPLLRGPDDARAVQRALAQTYGWWPADRAPRYWKSGGPGRAQPLVHVPLPEPGVLSGLAEAPPPGPVFQLRGAEAEIALRIGSAVSAEQAAALDHAAALALVDAWCVALEWVDVRWRDGLKAPALAQLADGQCHGGLLLGDWQGMDVLQVGLECADLRRHAQRRRAAGLYRHAQPGRSGLAAARLAAACGAGLRQCAGRDGGHHRHLVRLHAAAGR
jgi:2-keto-4-pentenoate hydratase